MPKNCEQCSAPLAPNQTFCRQCGSLTGDSGNDPTVMLCRPRPDASSPWAKVGTVGTLGAPNGRVAQTGTLASGNSAVVSPFIAHQQSLTHSDPAETEILDGEKTRIVSRANGPKIPHGWLVAVTGTDAGRDWRIQLGKNSIGRGNAVNISLSDDSVSALHALLWVDLDGKVTLVDRDSSNGTFVNKKQVFVPTTLEHDALIRFGERSVLQWVVFTQSTLT